MKSENIQDAIGMIDDDLVTNAKKHHKRIPLKYSVFISSVAALLVITISLGFILHPHKNTNVDSAAVTINPPENSTEEIADPPDVSSEKATIPQDSSIAKESTQTDSSHEVVSKPTDNTPVSIAPDSSSKPTNVKVKPLSIKKAAYPDMPTRPSDFSNSNDLEIWRNYRKEQTDKYFKQNVKINNFFSKSIPVFLSGEKNKNLLYSPVNVYMALCMLSEITDGNSRKQILDLFGVDSMDKLRSDAKTVWESNYCNDGSTTTVFANSLWMNQDIKFKQDTINSVADNYFASSFSGDPLSPAYNQMMRDWLNEQTGDFLKNYVDDIKMDSDMILTILSTIYFKATWSNKFMDQNTKPATFHANSGDITCDFMNQRINDTYYTGNNFSMVAQGIENSGKIFYILPDEGTSVDTLLKNSSIIDYITSPELYAKDSPDGNITAAHTNINLSVPKLDVSSKLDIIENLKKLGITDIFNPASSDFSPLVYTGKSGLYVSQADHAVRLKTDEDGCTAAAYTEIVISKSAAHFGDTVDFIVDRPFMFVITSPTGTILFTGVVNNPAQIK